MVMILFRFLFLNNLIEFVTPTTIIINPFLLLQVLESYSNERIEFLIA